MLHRAKLVTVCASVLAVFALASCDLGAVGPDASGSTDDGGDDVDPNCLPAVTNTDDGHHNPNTSCLNSSCHLMSDPGQGAPGFTIGGTLFRAPGASPAVTNATIEITDASSMVYALKTAANGNFYSDQAIVFPVTVRVSSCPKTKVMVAPVSDGNCGVCHVANGPAMGRVFLPE